MQKSKLIRLLKSLTKEEIFDFEQYLASPFFNNSVQILNLYRCFLAVYPDWEHSNLDKSVLFSRLFPKKNPKTSSALRELSSKLLQLLKNFLVFREFQANPHHQNLLLAKSLNKRKQADLFKQACSQAQDQLHKQSGKGITSTYYQFLLEEERFSFEVANNIKKGQMNLQELIDRFEQHSLLKRLQIYCLILNRHYLQSQDYDSQKLNELLVILEKKSSYQNPVIGIYYHTLKMLQGENEHFFKLKTLFDTHGNLLETRELRIQMTIAINYCNHAIAKGEQAFVSERVELYFYMLQHNLLHKGKYLPVMHIKNLCVLALKADQMNIAQQIVEDYKHQVAPKYVDDVYNFNKGIIEFYLCNYREAIYWLSQVQYINVFYQFDSKVLLLRSYYELNETFPLMDLADTFKKMIQRKRNLSQIEKSQYYNFVLILVKLYRVKALENKKSLQPIREQIGKEALKNKDWLLEKLEELAKMRGKIAE